jgi:hypothetical protein
MEWQPGRLIALEFNNTFLLISIFLEFFERRCLAHSLASVGFADGVGLITKTRGGLLYHMPRNMSNWGLSVFIILDAVSRTLAR